MDRRTLLKTGAAGGAGALGLDGCAHVPAAAEDDALLASIETRDVDRYLSNIDRRLAWIDEQRGDPLFPPLPQPCAPAQQAEYDRVSRLFKKSARSLYLTGCFLETPEEIQAHPGMQARIAAAQDDMDEAVFETTSLLEALTPEEHRGIRRGLEQHPEAVEELARMFDAPAKQDGIPLKRRYVLRAGILDLATRMRAQSPAIVIDPYVKKVRRIEARGPEAAASDASRVLAARIGEEAFWEHQDRMVRLASAWERRLAQSSPSDGLSGASPRTAPTAAEAAPAATSPDGGAPPAPTTGVAPKAPASGPGAAAVTAPPAKAAPAGPVSAPHPSPGRMPATKSSKPQPTRGERTVRTGGIIMGFGAASVGAGLIFAGLSHLTHVQAFMAPAVVLGITIGPATLVIGLIVVIVGAIMRVAQD